jgi:hypothetical protein
MPTDPRNTLRASVRAAQERYEADTEAMREARREAFAKAQVEGPSHSEIAAEVGLHKSRVGQGAHNIEWTSSNTESALCAPGEALLGPGFAFTNSGKHEAGWLQAMPFTNGEKRGVSGQITSDSGGGASAEVVVLCLK